LESAADRLPNQPELLYDLAWAYYSVGRIANAEKSMLRRSKLGWLAARMPKDSWRWLTLLTAPPKSRRQLGRRERSYRQTQNMFPPNGLRSSRGAGGNFKAANKPTARPVGFSAVYSSGKTTGHSGRNSLQ